MEDNNQQENKEVKEPSPPHLTPKISPVKAAFLGLFGGFFLYQVIGGGLTLLIFGMNPKNTDINAFRLMTIAGEILFILLPALIFAKIIYEDVTEIIRFRTAPWKEIVLFVIGIIALTPLLENFLYIQNYFIELLAKNNHAVYSIKLLLDKVDKMVEETFGDLLRVHSFLDVVIVITAVSIIPAISEEVMFRGFIQRSFELKYKPITAALITAVFFGLYHFNPYGLIALIGLGLYFGYAAYKSKSILIPVILHFINNFAAVIIYFIFGDTELIQNKAAGKAELNSVYFNFAYQLIIFIVIMVIIMNYYKKKEEVRSIEN
jgi:hypothetical protein